MSLPFADLLALLRAEGLAIGPDDHLRVARLLDRYDGASRDDLRGALAALLARDADEVARVRAAFDLLYPADDAPITAEAAASARAPRRWRPGALGAGLLIVAGVAVGLVAARSRPPEIAPATSIAAPRETPPDALRWTSDPCDPPVRDDVTYALLLSLGAALVLGVSSRRRGRGRRGAWSARRWREALDALPSPRWYDLELAALTVPPIPRADLDDAATWLGRGRLTARHGELDVERTVEATVAAGGAPAPRFRPRPAPAAVLVLADTGAAMAPWRPHAEALVGGLRGRGVHVEIARFVDRPDVVRVDGEVLPLATLAQRAGHLPLLGVGPRAPTDLPALRRFARRAWLNPVPDAAWWAPGFAAAEVDVWPLTRGGLLAAARHLVGHAAPPAAGGPGAVRLRDVERLRLLRGLLPRPDDAQALALARTVASDTRAAAIVALAADPARDDAAAAERWLRDHDDPLVCRPAHLRRVVFHHIDFPDADGLARIVAAHFPPDAVAEGLAARAVERFVALRDALPDWQKRPATGELLVWVRVLTRALGADAAGAVRDAPLHALPCLQALVKTRRDLERLRQTA